MFGGFLGLCYISVLLSLYYTEHQLERIRANERLLHRGMAALLVRDGVRLLSGGQVVHVHFGEVPARAEARAVVPDLQGAQVPRVWQSLRRVSRRDAGAGDLRCSAQSDSDTADATWPRGSGLLLVHDVFCHAHPVKQ